MTREPINPDARCDECSNAAMGQAGVFCLEYREAIFDESAAEDCHAYDPLPPPTPPLPMADRIEAFFARQHYQLWGKSWQISNQVDRRAAAEWLASVYAEVTEGGSDA